MAILKLDGPGQESQAIFANECDPEMSTCKWLMQGAEMVSKSIDKVALGCK
jgi:hypothetical protein